MNAWLTNDERLVLELFPNSIKNAYVMDVCQKQLCIKKKTISNSFEAHEGQSLSYFFSNRSGEAYIVLKILPLNSIVNLTETD